MVHSPLIDCHVGVENSTGLEDTADVSDMEAQIIRDSESGGLVLVPVQDKPTFQLFHVPTHGRWVFTTSLVTAGAATAIAAAAWFGFLYRNLTRVDFAAI